MSKKAYINAISATLYIVLVATIMSNGSRWSGGASRLMLLVPIAVMSLFTLSAAVMGYLFLYEPSVLFFEGKRKEGVRLFLQTVAVFAVLTGVAFFLLFSGIF